MADSPLVVFGVVLVAFMVAMLLMAIGVLARRPCLRGSCGGIGCEGCPARRRKA